MKTTQEALSRLYPLFIPSYNNSFRFVGLVSAIFVLPTANFLIPQIASIKKDDIKGNNDDLMLSLITASSVAVVGGLQQFLATTLRISAVQAMKKKNIELLTDGSKFLINGHNKDISSLQYVTIGVGVSTFAETSIGILIGLPMYVITSIATIVNIGIVTESISTAGVIVAFVMSFTIANYLFSKGSVLYQCINQKIENDLVGKVNFIEANSNSIELIGSTSIECESVIQGIKKIQTSIYKIGTLDFLSTITTMLSLSIAGQFLGLYYKDGSIDNVSDTKAITLNIMLVSLISSLRNIVGILTLSYSYTKLNIEQLEAFSNAYSNCVDNNNNNRMSLEFSGSQLSITDFSVYKPNLDIMFNKLNLELLPGKVYKLSAKSGSGKTTFLKAITNNWQYTTGAVQWPLEAENKIYFVPQGSFFPNTSCLLKILTYPLEPEQFVLDNNGYNESAPLLQDLEETNTTSDSMDSFINKIQNLLRDIGLMPKSIKEEELEDEYINWNDRLSGGEKQKLAIVGALLKTPKYLILDEVTSALDDTNKQLVYNLIKQYLQSVPGFIVIYTEHAKTEKFASAFLDIDGDTISQVPISGNSVEDE